MENMTGSQTNGTRKLAVCLRAALSYLKEHFTGGDRNLYCNWVIYVVE